MRLPIGGVYIYGRRCGIVPKCTATSCTQWGGNAIPVTPEVAPIEKKKPKRSAKSKSEQPVQAGDSTIQTHPTLLGMGEPTKVDQIANGAPAPVKEVYDWDRTGAEALQRAEDLRIAKTPFPTPDSRTLPPDRFYAYWNDLIKTPVGKYAKAFIRRWKPILEPEVQVDERSGLSKEAHPSERKWTKDDGELNEIGILKSIGVGSYTIRLNDNRLPWDRGTVVHCEKFATMQDYDQYPPVFDKARLDWDEEDNRPYIKWATSRGGLRRPDEYAKDESDMANAQVVDTALSEARQARAANEQLLKEELDRTRKELEAAKAVKPPAPVAPATPVTELQAMGTVLTSLVTAIKPAPDNSLSDYLRLQAEREKTEREREREERESSRKAAADDRKRADDLQAEVLKELRDTAKAPLTTMPAAVPKTSVEALQELVTQQTLLKQLTGRGGAAATEEESPGKVDKWLEAAQYLGPIAQTFLQGVFQTIQYGVKTWGEVHHNDALGRNGQPSTTMPTETKQPIKPSDPAPNPEQQAQKQQWDAIMQSAFMVVPHMLTSLEADPPESGAEFAAFIIKRGPEKRVSYDKLRSLADALKAIGVQIPGNDIERFIGACRFVFEKMPPPLNRILGIPTVPQFLTDFYNYDQILEQQEEQ